MELHVADHPLIAHKLSVLRERSTDTPTFRRLTDELVALLAFEATREIEVEPWTLHTPLVETVGVRLTSPGPIIVPILRAGLGMLEGMQRILPTAEVGFLGMIRNEKTLAIETYAERLPDNLTNRHCFVVDPMLATGGTLSMAVEFLADRGATHITAVTLLAAPEGVERLRKETENLKVRATVVTAALDEGLDENAYIVPGLGDAGDRLYGVVD